MDHKFEYLTRSSLLTPSPALPQQSILNGNLSKNTVADDFARIFADKSLFISSQTQDNSVISLIINWNDLASIYLQLFIPPPSITDDLIDLIRFLELKLKVKNRTINYSDESMMILDIQYFCNVLNTQNFVMFTRTEFPTLIRGYEALRRYQVMTNEAYVETNLSLKPINTPDKIEVLDDSFLDLVNKKCGDVINVDELTKNSMIYNVSGSGVVHSGSFGVFKLDLDFNSYLCNENIEHESLLRKQVMEWSAATKSCLSINLLCVPLNCLTYSILNESDIIDGIDETKSILDQKYDAMYSFDLSDLETKKYVTLLIEGIKKKQLTGYPSKWVNAEQLEKLQTMMNSNDVTVSAPTFNLNLPIFLSLNTKSKKFDKISVTYNDLTMPISSLGAITDGLLSIWRRITAPIRNFNFSATAATLAQEKILPYLKKRFNLDKASINTFDEILDKGFLAFQDKKLRDDIGKVLLTSILPTIIDGFGDYLGKGDLPKSRITRLYQTMRENEIDRLNSLTNVTDIPKRQIKLVKKNLLNNISPILN